VVIANLKKRGINAWYCERATDAVQAISRMIPERSTVAIGGSVSLMQSGMLDVLRRMNVDFLDRYKPGLTDAEIEQLGLRSITADVHIASCNAVTADGKLVNEDGRGTRVAGIIYGPRKVILMVGVNKIVSTVEEGLARIKEIAAPLNCVRLGLDTPCVRTGFCDDANCHPPARICCQISIIESNRVKDRLNVFLVGEELGY
jgi:L-lactate utilization protein LutB